MDDEEVLAGGNLNAVVRVGDTVRRRTGPWTPAVHLLLRHLEAVSYPAPRPRGIDGSGREVLTFVPGETIHPDHRHLLDDAGLRRVGALIQDYHEAQRSFVPPPDAEWCALARDPSGSEEVVAHDDLAPWNLVAGPTWTFIDWDLCAPGRRDWDLAWALHSSAQLWEEQSTEPEPTARRITAFLDGARVPVRRRPAVLALVVERITHNVTEMRRRAAQGDAIQQRLVDGGHDAMWEAGARHVATNLERWSALLSTP